jgi:predicted RND superfamily exporter protein
MNLEKLLKKIAFIQTRYPYLTVIFIIILSIFIWGGVSKVQTVASLEKMMPYEIEEIKAMNTLRDSNLGQDMLAIIFEIDRKSTDINHINDIRDIEVYNYIKELKKSLEIEAEIIETYSYVDIIDFYMKYENLTYSQILNDKDHQNEISRFVNDDKSLTVLILSTDIATNDMKINLLADHVKDLIQSKGKPNGIQIKLSGTPMIQQKLGELISSDRESTQWISTLFVFTLTALIFRSFLSAIVPILIVFISVNWLYGTMGYTNLPISTLAGGVAAMVIGIGIDFAIHLMNKFKFERKQGNSIENSIELALVNTGSALVVTSLTTISAFLAFLFGLMPEMGRFGMLMAIGIFYSLMFTIIGLPALLVIEEKIIYGIKNKMRFGLEGEFHLEENKKKLDRRIKK